METSLRSRRKKLLKTQPPIFNSSPSQWKLLIEEKNRGRMKVRSFSSFRVIENINNKLTPRQKQLFSKTCFGKFLQLQKPKFSGILIDQLLQRQLACPLEESSIWFRLGGKECEFGLKEFALITGLNCDGSERFQSESRTRICNEYFGGKDKLSIHSIARAFNDCDGSDEDVVKLAQIYFLEGFLLSRDQRSEPQFSSVSVKLVDCDRKFEQYPWGRIVYEQTISPMKHRFANSLPLFKYYYLTGFPFALQCWAYECIPELRGDFKSRIEVPRMLKWCRFKEPDHTLQREILRDDSLEVITKLRPSKAELSYFSRKQKLKKTNAIVQEDDGSSVEVVEKFHKIEDDDEDYNDVNKNDERKNAPRKQKLKKAYAIVHEDDGSSVEILGNFHKIDDDEQDDNDEDDDDHDADDDNYDGVKEYDKRRNAYATRGCIRRKTGHNLKPGVQEMNKKDNAEISESSTSCTPSVASSTDSVRLVVSIETDVDDSDANDVVRGKRKRDVTDTPCFTVDLFEHPPQDEKEEFDRWINDGLKRNSKKKYSEALNKIKPGFKFSNFKCKRKDWFFSLNETEQWLNGTHVDVALHFLRKKKNDHPDLFKTRSAITSSWFYRILMMRYSQFKRDPGSFDWSKESTLLEGEVSEYSQVWSTVDTVYIPVNVNSDHWVATALDLKNQVINVYNSYRVARHTKRVMMAIAPIAEMVPWLVKSKNRAPWKINLVDGIPEQENGGDCGIFMLKFIEFLMQDMPLDECTQKNMPFFRNKMAVELYALGKRTQER